MSVLDADGRCGRCRGEVTSGGCPRCDWRRTYAVGQAIPIGVSFVPSTIRYYLPRSPSSGDAGRGDGP